jgi:hypothetical protein
MSDEQDALGEVERELVNHILQCYPLIVDKIDTWVRESGVTALSTDKYVMDSEPLPGDNNRVKFRYSLRRSDGTLIDTLTFTVKVTCE